jgi:hypothetical protein
MTSGGRGGTGASFAGGAGASTRGGTTGTAGDGASAAGTTNNAATAGDGGTSAGSSGAGPGGTAGETGTGVGGAIAGSGGVGGELGVGEQGGIAGEAGLGGEAGIGAYLGPSVGSAKPFAILAYSAVAAANVSMVTGEIGVSAGAVSTISGFDDPDDIKYGLDSLSPNDQRTILAQQDITSLVGDIDARACDADFTNVVGGLTGDITLSPGVTCMSSFSADVLLNGTVTLDAGNDPNAFFIIRGNRALEAAVGTQVELINGAQACAVFWRFSTEVTLATGVEFYGNVISGTAITMTTGATLLGRVLARTAGVQVDANTITIPVDGLVGSAGVCTHMQ